MKLTSRAANDPNDLNRILEFSYRFPDQCIHVEDLPYRLCSPAVQNPQNVQLWEDESGALVAFAVIQLPFSTVDQAVIAGYEYLEEEVVHWVVKRLETIAKEREDGFGFLLDSLESNNAVAQKHGFVLDDWHMRHLATTLNRDIVVPTLPPEFTLRSLRPDEARDYVRVHRAAFDSTNMTDEWRERTLQHPYYRPDLDLVIANEQGELVAFCIGWACKVNGENVGQIEPLGILPDFQRKGLGRTILLENLRRMKANHTERVYIDAESYNPASQHLYESVGFQDTARVYKYFRRFD